MASIPVLLELPPRTPATQPGDADPDQPEITATDMEDFSAENKCACAASDDNPY